MENLWEVRKGSVEKTERLRYVALTCACALVVDCVCFMCTELSR